MNILIITSLVVATVATVLHILSICKMVKDTDRRVQEIKQNMLKSKRMANAEPECSRCLICGKKFVDGGSFRLYKGKWFCVPCYDLFIKKLKNENEFNKACKEFNVEVKAGEK